MVSHPSIPKHRFLVLLVRILCPQTCLLPCSPLSNPFSIIYHTNLFFEHSSDWQSCHQTAGTSSTSPDRAVAQAQPAIQQQRRSYHRRSGYLSRLQREDWQSTVDRIQFLGAEEFRPFSRASRGRATTTARMIIIGPIEFYISLARSIST
jgi:hypothetical protein